jgi:hypothetical protein
MQCAAKLRGVRGMSEYGTKSFPFIVICCRLVLRESRPPWSDGEPTATRYVGLAGTCQQEQNNTELPWPLNVAGN